MDKRFAKDAIWTVASKVAALAVRFVSGVLLARLLTPSGRGAFALLQTYPGLINNFAELGIRQAIVRLLGGKLVNEKRLVGNTATLWLLTTTLGAALVIALYSLGSRQPHSNLSVLLAAALVPPGIAASYARGVFLGKEHLASFNRIVWGTEIVFLLTIVTLFLLGHLSVEGALGSLVFSTTMTAVVSAFMVHRLVPLSFAWDLPTLATMTKLGLAFGTNTVLLLLQYRMQVLLLGRFSTAHELGLFAVAISLAELMWQLPTTLGQVVLSKSANATDARGFSLQMARLHRIGIPLAGAAAVALGLLLYFLVPLVYGREFKESVPMIWLLLPGIASFCCYRILQMDLQGKGKVAVTITTIIPGLILNAVLGLILIPKLGGRGSAIAASASYLLGSALMVRAYRKEFNLKWADLLLPNGEDVALLTRKLSSTLPIRKIRPA